MHKTMRESKMLEEVRRWRAEAYESLRRQPRDARLQRARDWADRLGLPILEEDSETRANDNMPATGQTREP